MSSTQTENTAEQQSSHAVSMLSRISDEDAKMIMNLHAHDQMITLIFATLIAMDAKSLELYLPKCYDIIDGAIGINADLEVIRAVHAKIIRNWDSVFANSISLTFRHAHIVWKHLNASAREYIKLGGSQGSVSFQMRKSVKNSLICSQTLLQILYQILRNRESSQELWTAFKPLVTTLNECTSILDCEV